MDKKNAHLIERLIARGQSSLVQARNVLGDDDTSTLAELVRDLEVASECVRQIAQEEAGTDQRSLVSPDVAELARTRRKAEGL